MKNEYKMRRKDNNDNVEKCGVSWLAVEMANKTVPVGIARTRPRFDGESPH